MMKFFLLPMILLGLFASAMAAQHLPVSHGPDEGDGGRFRPVVLGVGDTLDLPDGTTVEFVALLEDSRCPADAMCIWQGQARLQFEHDGEPFVITFQGPDDASVVLGGYGMQVLDVQPYPLASQPHDPADTEVTVRLFAPAS
ncbi:MAG: hypothetical protein M0R75_00035 [Dehalococcoidia bacterium]|nr:hypothetical protein [Dehalococcoidia bacterium]